MILRFPDYYERFKCTADKCSDSCCIGWELDIDEKTYDFYKKTGGDFGKRLKEWMEDGSDETGACNTFRLNGERCPFLNDKNLCDIYINLGEGALCKVCAEYPRFTVEYGNIRERSMAFSCEEVGRLIFENEAPTTFKEKEIRDIELTESAEAIFINETEYIRDEAVRILQDRKKDFYERLTFYLNYVNKAQEVLNEEESYDGELLKRLKNIKTENFEVFSADFSELWEEIIYLLGGLESLNPEWENTLSELKKKFDLEMLSELEGFRETNNKINIYFEHIAVYFTFRYFTKAVYDGDILNKAKFAVFGFFVIRSMAALRYIKNNRKLDVGDIVDVCRIYSKEVEHSDDNVFYLMEEFLFSEKFETENLLKNIKTGGESN